ncbi:MAG: prepilin-type N-terminal cleavage/methylation domain-containing protein [Candidatus Sumerlaeia bacterium]
MAMNACRDHTGFTLIELLIVVAIIAILAAIAIPNFMLAQTRAKISRVKSDLRTIATAVEAYGVDNSVYPYPLDHANNALTRVHELTTPISYLISVSMTDPFPQRDAPAAYWYDNYSGAFIEDNPNLDRFKFNGYCLASVGPDCSYDAVALLPPFLGTNMEPSHLGRLYDPTNGTISIGDIARWSGKQSMEN